MKIGILTYHRSENYGAALQAYALQAFLLSQGHSVEFVDYVHPEHKRMYDIYNKNKLKNKTFFEKIKYNISVILKFRRLYTRKKRFEKFRNRYFITSSETEFSQNKYDIAFYGSDQIWRKQHALGLDDFNDVYFGSDFINANKKVSYAASMGILHNSEKDIAKLEMLLKNFNAISVREKDLYNLIQPLTDKKVEVVLDPVFLINLKEWKQIITKRIVKEKYILLYNLIHNDDAVACAKQIAKKNGYDIIEINGRIESTLYYKSKRLNNAGPLEFLSLLSYSEFVVSTSFHGIAFSIIFNKQFYAFLKEHSERVVNILDMFNLSDRFYPKKEEIAKMNNINFDAVNLIVERDIAKSVEFIENSINL